MRRSKNEAKSGVEWSVEPRERPFPYFIEYSLRRQSEKNKNKLFINIFINILYALLVVVVLFNFIIPLEQSVKLDNVFNFTILLFTFANIFLVNNFQLFFPYIISIL